ncbi:uncharacterized protein LOC110849168 isoform X2 [Folsomia candida]|uniref:uncharacterized protein LOC110849168 isoform X2 n=1 Tax=Folsomia candida TaxID=158441 RepID=UPI0016054C20|nr:uncharacterized protein LOC110849168 isoform X2 [Folsomia candida]
MSTSDSEEIVERTPVLRFQDDTPTDSDSGGSHVVENGNVAKDDEPTPSPPGVGPPTPSSPTENVSFNQNATVPPSHETPHSQISQQSPNPRQERPHTSPHFEFEPYQPPTSRPHTAYRIRHDDLERNVLAPYVKSPFPPRVILDPPYKTKLRQFFNNIRSIGGAPVVPTDNPADQPPPPENEAEIDEEQQPNEPHMGQDEIEKNENFETNENTSPPDEIFPPESRIMQPFSALKSLISNTNYLAWTTIHKSEIDLGDLGDNEIDQVNEEGMEMQPIDAQRHNRDGQLEMQNLDEQAEQEELENEIVNGQQAGGPEGMGIIGAANQLMAVNASRNRFKEMAEMKRNLFLGAHQSLQAIVNVGACQLLCPFGIWENDGVFELKSNIIHAGLVNCMIMGATSLKAYDTSISWTRSQLKGKPETTGILMIDASSTLMLFCYLFCVTFKRNKFGEIYKSFKIQSEQVAEVTRKKKLRLLTVTSVLALGYFLLTNWTEWLSSTVVGIMAMNVVTLLLLFHIDLMLWGISLSSYLMERTLREIYNNPDLDINKKIEAFRSVKSHIHAVNSAIGPLIMASVVQMIPYGVLIIHLVSKAKTLDQLPWLHMFIMVIKLGHIIVASEAAANAENLSSRIMSDRATFAQGNADLAYELITVSTKSIYLKGLDFFDVNYRTVLSILGAFITYYLVVVDMKEDDPNHKKLIKTIVEQLANRTLIQ